MKEPFKLYIAGRDGKAFCFHSCRTLKEAQEKQLQYVGKKNIKTYIRDVFNNGY